MRLLFALLSASLCFPATMVHAEEVLRAGIVGCDTSHVVAFTKLINDPAATGPLAKVEVVCAYPGGSPDIPSSRDRVQGFTEQLRAQGVTIVDSIAEVVEQSDVILLESVDGRVHLDQFSQVAHGKPVFVDKPAAASLKDVIAIFRVAKESGTPCFSSSGLRFSENIVALAQNKAIGELTGCSVVSPYETEAHHPDLFWYGVHGVESVYTLMGPGCQTVSRIEGDKATVVAGKWADGRIAAYHGLKGNSSYAFTVFGTKGIAQEQDFSGYEPLVCEICEFLLGAEPPVSADETIEIFAFMEAADESLRQGGRPVAVKEIIARAERELDAEAKTQAGN